MSRVSGKNVKPGREKFDAPSAKPKAPDVADVTDATIETHPGQVVRLEPPAPVDRMAGTEPKPTGRTPDEAYRA